MTDKADFLAMGLELARRAVQEVIGRDNLQLDPRTMPRSRRARANGRLKQIGVIVRRLILLMALALKPAPPAPRAPATPKDLPEGVELAIFPRVAQYCFTLMPAAQAPVQTGEVRDSSGSSPGQSGPVSTRPLIGRILALQRILNAPEAAARRLARTLERMKARGEPRPVVGQSVSAYRLSAELGAAAAALPGLVRAALETWESSG